MFKTWKQSFRARLQNTACTRSCKIFRLISPVAKAVKVVEAKDMQPTNVEKRIAFGAGFSVPNVAEWRAFQEISLVGCATFGGYSNGCTKLWPIVESQVYSGFSLCRFFRICSKKKILAHKALISLHSCFQVHALCISVLHWCHQALRANATKIKISKLCRNKHSITGNLQVQSNQQLRVKASVRDKNFRITQQRPWILKFTFVCDESDTLWLVQVIYRNNRIHLLRAMYNQCNNWLLFLA